MIEIPDWLKKDYLHVNSLKNICSDKNLRVSENKDILIDQIIEYAGENKNSKNYQEIYQWLLSTMREGSKDLCYRKIYTDELEVAATEKKILSIYPTCKNKNIFETTVEENYSLIEYELIGDRTIQEAKFTFAKKVLEKLGTNDLGTEEIYPVFIDVYFEEGFIVCRTQPKALLYEYSSDKLVKKERKINTIKDGNNLTNKIIDIFGFEYDKKNCKQRVMKMLYELYKVHGDTPESVKNKIGSMEKDTKSYLITIFEKLKLDITNIPKAFEDLGIFLEKYISIESNMENEFKADRDAYIIKIAADDALQMTKIDAASAITKPLQCTDIFYDSKKSIMNTKECRKLNLCYNRKRGYLGPFLVQHDARDGFGMLKVKYFAEEVDIQNVLQTVFRNY